MALNPMEYFTIAQHPNKPGMVYIRHYPRHHFNPALLGKKSALPFQIQIFLTAVTSQLKGAFAMKAKGEATRLTVIRGRFAVPALSAVVQEIWHVLDEAFTGKKLEGLPKKSFRWEGTNVDMPYIKISTTENPELARKIISRFGENTTVGKILAKVLAKGIVVPIPEAMALSPKDRMIKRFGQPRSAKASDVLEVLGGGARAGAAGAGAAKKKVHRLEDEELVGVDYDF